MFGPHAPLSRVGARALPRPRTYREDMTRYLISFPAKSLVLTEENLEEVSRTSRAVVEEARAAGVFVFASGLDPQIPAVTVSQDGSISESTDPGTAELNGGMMVVEVPSRAEAIVWAAKVARGCSCPQELREFMYDPDV